AGSVSSGDGVLNMGCRFKQYHLSGMLGAKAGVPDAQGKAADLQNRSALHLLQNSWLEIRAKGAPCSVSARLAAESMSSWDETNSSTSPMLKACVAGTRSAVRSKCSAVALPRRRGNRCVPPQPVSNPRAAPGWPNDAS